MQTLDPPTTADLVPSAPRGPRHLLAVLAAAAVGGVLAAGTTWLVVATVSLDITPAAVGM